VVTRGGTIAVYMLANRRNGTLYIGVTGDLVRRVRQHREKASAGFTNRYDVTRLVWYQRHDSMTAAIQRETSIKRYPRAWKIKLIEALNPHWVDLYNRLNC